MRVDSNVPGQYEFARAHCPAPSRGRRRSTIYRTGRHPGKLEAQSRRTQAEQSRLEERLSRVENSAIFRTLRAFGQAGANTKGRLGQALLRSPLHPLYAKFRKPAKDADPAYAAWIAAEHSATLPVTVLTEESRSWPYQPRISILMPVYRPRREWIEAAILSVQTQSYENWQLCVCCDGPAEPWLDDWLRRRVSEDARIRVAFAAERRGIASALNGAGTLADGEYLAFLDQDDLLSRDGPPLYRRSRCNMRKPTFFTPTKTG